MLKQKKVSCCILAFIATICLSIGPFVSSTKADTHLWYTSNGYTADLAWVNKTIEHSDTGNPTGSYYPNPLYLTEITINWNIIGDGYFSINTDYYESDSVFLCENCKLTSYTVGNNGGGVATFYYNKQNCVKIYFYHVKPADTPTGFSGVWNLSTTSDNAYLNQIYMFLANNLYDSTNNIHYIGHMDGTLSDIESTLNSILAETDNVEESLSSLITTSQYNIEPYQHAAWIYSSKYDSSFPRWKYGLPYMSYLTSYNSQNYTASHGIRLATGYSYTMLFYSSKALTTSDITIYYNGTGNVTVSTIPITEINSQLYLMGIIFKNERTGFSTFEAEFGQTFELYPLYFGLTNNIPDEIRALYGMEFDNTYTRLLQQISQGISALQSDQTVIDNSTTVTNNFNTEVTKINNIETTILTNFDNRLNTVNAAITDSGVLTDTINQLGNRWADFYIGKVFDNLVVIKYPIYIILIGFVLLCLLG